jgi:UDP-2,3-diacylglucosamine hydrolase
MFLSLGLRTRQRIAAWARRRSMTANRNKPADIMDVSPQAITRAFEQSGLDTMVHGHTHRPAVHTLTVGARTRTRIVLPDWHYEGADTRGGWLVVDQDGPRLVQLPSPPGPDTR